MASVDAQVHSVGATILDTIDALLHDCGLLSRDVIKRLFVIESAGGLVGMGASVAG